MLLLPCLLGTALLGGGGSALNQYWERRPDGAMSRTGSRPLPAGRLVPPAALWFGSILAAAGLALLLLAGWFPALLGALTFGLYLFAYTPLKRVTPHSVFVGAVPGALPPLIGWAAAGGSLGAEAWALFAILFIWQVPHFMAIAWLYREDYRAAGFPMVSVLDRDGRLTALEMVWTTVILILASLAPAVLGFAGPWYLSGALLLGLGLFFAALRFARERTDARARQALRASIIYLPLLFLLLILDRV
jgi:protoheme IX farnesyltransferase